MKTVKQALFMRDGWHGLRIGLSTGQVEILLPRSPDAMPAGTTLLEWDSQSGWMRVGKTIAVKVRPVRLAGPMRQRRRRLSRARVCMRLSAQVKVTSKSKYTFVTDPQLKGI